MSWLKTRKGSLDIAKRRDDLAKHRKSSSMDDGKYQCGSTDKSNIKCKTGIISNGLQDLTIIENAAVGTNSIDKDIATYAAYTDTSKDNDNDDGDEHKGSTICQAHHHRRDILLKCETNLDDVEIKINEKTDKTDLTVFGVVDLNDNVSTDDSNVRAGTDIDKNDDDEDRDHFPDENMNEFKMRKCYNKPRLSLDSKMALLPTLDKYNNTASGDEDFGITSSLRKDSSSVSSLNEDEHSDEPQTLPKKKSISWASDLETIHEFQKIKGRRLSLTSLFKKY